jgi:hypothetical protein
MEKVVSKLTNITRGVLESTSAIDMAVSYKHVPVQPAAANLPGCPRTFYDIPKGF